MFFDPVFNPYPSRRYPIYARRGMVATSSPLASAAGLEVLQAGGNAVDAAVATAAALTVLEPASNGIGGDAFALVWFNDKLHGINGSGPAPKNISIDKVLSKNPEGGCMPGRGWTPVTVPGAPKTWAALIGRFGELPLSAVMAPAVRYAVEGYPVAPVLSTQFRMAYEEYSKNCTAPEFEEWWKTFMPEGSPPEAGDILRLPNHADTLAAIGDTGADAFYTGYLADRLVADSEAFGGYFCKEDLAGYDVKWVEPISVRYRGYDVWEIPPNGQGIVALIALNILKEFDFAIRDSADSFHRQMEAIKIAFADAFAHVTDPGFMAVDYNDLLKPGYGARRAGDIEITAAEAKAWSPAKGGTVYLCTADSKGNMVSFIQSNYAGFGSGAVVRDTGIALQNRGMDFSLDPRHINCLAPGKKTYHTIIPGFLTKDGKAAGPFGVMGGYMQPQGHVQVLMNLIDYGLNPQQALDAPRWMWVRDKHVLVEGGFPVEIARQLKRRGHRVEVSLNGVFGRGQMILRLPGGVLIGGAEPRADSNIACY